MNTLSRAITSRFFTHPQDYIAFRKHWSALINSERKHELTATHHLLYQASCGKDWRKAFTPPSNQRKLANGAFTGWILWRALYQIHWTRDEAALLTPFDDLITPEILQQIRVLLPKPHYAYRPDQFADRQWPFEAYLANEAMLVH